MFETKDSGKRAEFEGGMVRDTNEGKPRFELCLAKGLPYEKQMLTRFAHLMARGAIKYNSWNWMKATKETDEDHAAAVMFNLMAYESIIAREEP
jgi:hypothetical protein